MDAEAVIREALGAKFQGLSLADRDRLVSLVLGVSKAQQAPVERSIDRMVGLLEQLVARDASPRVVERVLMAATGGAVGESVEMTPELVSRLMGQAMQTNMDDVTVEVGESAPVSDAVERLRRMKSGGLGTKG